MNERLLEKLRKILGKLGVEEGKIENIIDEVANEGEEVDVANEPAPEEPTEPTEEPMPEETEGEGVAEDNAPIPEPVEESPVVEEPQPPVEEPSQDVNPADLIPNGEPPVEQPMPEEPVPPVPSMEDHTQELLGQIDELQKANEGLITRIDALEKALKDSGIMTEEKGGVDVGVDNSRTPSNEEIYDPMPSVLSMINGHR